MLQRRLRLSGPGPPGRILPAADAGGRRRGAERGTVPSAAAALPVISITQIQ